MSAQTDFTKKVIAAIKKIPKGKVATYGQIARIAGKPQGSRGVAWILHSSSQAQDLPWFRVINSQGKISFPVMSEHWIRQKNHLAREGVELGAGEKISLKTYQWKKGLS